MKERLLFLRPPTFWLGLALCVGIGCQTGCKNETHHDDLHLSSVEDALNLSQLKTQASFRAMVVTVNAATNRADLSGRTGEVVSSNFYQLVLRDEQERKHIFAGVNASAADIAALASLVESNTYTFPDVFSK